MKFGICLNAERAMNDAPASADYIELSASEIYAMDEERFEALCDAVANKKFKTYSANNLIDASIRLTGPDVNFDTLSAYCDKTFARLSKLGITMLVFGSGKSRNVPDGFSPNEAWEQLVRVGQLLAQKAEQYGQTVVIEPLAYNKVNIIHTFADGVRYASDVDRQNFKTLVDFYHFESNGEPYSSLGEGRTWLAHTHFATAKSRTMPNSDADWQFFKENLYQLKAIGYDGSMSFEGGIFPTDEFDAMIAKMKEIEQTI